MWIFRSRNHVPAGREELKETLYGALESATGNVLYQYDSSRNPIKTVDADEPLRNFTISLARAAVAVPMHADLVVKRALNYWLSGSVEVARDILTVEQWGYSTSKSSVASVVRSLVYQDASYNAARMAGKATESLWGSLSVVGGASPKDEDNYALGVSQAKKWMNGQLERYLEAPW